MKKIAVIISCVFLAVGCNSNSVEKPQNLIGKETMVAILYDMALLEAIKTQNINGGISSKVGSDYVYKKYKIDSLQFVKSNKYYAADIDEYKKMFEQVKARLVKETQKTESELKKSGKEVPPTVPKPVNPDTPQIQ